MMRDRTFEDQCKDPIMVNEPHHGDITEYSYQKISSQSFHHLLLVDTPPYT